MSSIKCTYFDLPALGEPIRLLLAYGGQEFEDVRVSMEEWDDLKPTLQFGQIPVYEEDGKVVNQSLAICRYLGKKYKLVGNDDWDDLEIDAIADTTRDLVNKVAEYHYETSESAKEKKDAVLFAETLPFYLEKLEKIAKENDGHLAAKKLTWADFFFGGMLDYISLMAKKDLTEGNPNLAAVKNNVLKEPAVAKWYEKKPLNMETAHQWIAMTGKPSQP